MLNPKSKISKDEFDASTLAKKILIRGKYQGQYSIPLSKMDFKEPVAHGCRKAV